jgi:hypothetical protein
MSKKFLLALAILVTAPFALVNCAASGSGSVSPGDDDASSSTRTDDGGSSSSTRTRD